ncbi:MAG: YtxH domain-containing protein [Ignavibacteria bacterium]|nr:YtxH domain-containing protein [Ignavibacteria bacterium]
MTLTKQISGIFFGLVLGGAVGSAIALLYAPKEGKYLRRDISRKANEFVDEERKKVSDSWNGIKEKTGHILDSANDAVKSNVEFITDKTVLVADAFISGYNAYKEEKNSAGGSRKRQEEDFSRNRIQRI